MSVRQLVMQEFIECEHTIQTVFYFKLNLWVDFDIFRGKKCSDFAFISIVSFIFSTYPIPVSVSKTNRLDILQLTKKKLFITKQKILLKWEDR